jgi:hypothetical protein
VRCLPAPASQTCARLLTTEDVADPHDPLLPALDASASLACWPTLDAQFCRQPQWRGNAAETGAIARRQGRAEIVAQAFAARWLARLDELRDWAPIVQESALAVRRVRRTSGPGRGRSLVETARGLLMHEIVLDGERIADYSIVAPTEWNFHPQGPLAGWLMGRDAGDREALYTFAARAVAALDPCVRWELEWL